MRKHASGLWMPDYMEGPARYLLRAGVCMRAISFCKNYGTVIQAGGHIGIWPLVLSKFFDTVITVEPEPVNAECLIANTSDTDNIIPYIGALSDHGGKVKINHREYQSGAHHVMTNEKKPWIEVQALVIDELDTTFNSLDLLMLDVEGYEPVVLHGALKRIRKHWPVIVIENNGGEKKFGFEKEAARKMLEAENYGVVDSFDEDIIMVHSGKKQ